MKTDPIVVSTPSEELSPRQLMCGTCVALAASSHRAIEPLCCFTPTLSSASARDTECGQDFLLCATSPYGMWPVLSGDDEEGTWVNHDPVFKERELVNGLTDELLERMLPFRAIQVRLAQLMQHVANHSTYHRGQVALMMRQLGAEPVATDFHVFLVECSSEAAPAQ